MRMLTALLTGVALAAPMAAQIPIPPDTVTTVPVEEVLDGLGALGGVTVDALGFVYVANFRDAVWRISPDGSAKKLTDALYGSSGNVVDREGNLYQSNFNANSIVRIRRDGEVETFARGLNGPVGLTFDGDGNLYVCNCSDGSIARVTPDGAVSEFARSPLMACPNGIVQDDRGDFYVVNFSSPRILRITPDGEVEEFAQIPGAGGLGHITFARGGFFITQFRGHGVFRLSRDGEATRIAGDGTRAVVDGPAGEARLSFPNGIAAAPSGNVLWVNDLVGPQGAGEPTTIALRRIRLVTLTDVMAAAVDAAEAGDHPRVVRETWAAYREAKPWDDVRGDAVTVAYRFLSSGRIAGAMALFELNAETHAEDPSSNYHLGEAYRYTGQPGRAAEQYERTLELDPDFPQAAERLALVRNGNGALDGDGAAGRE